MKLVIIKIFFSLLYCISPLILLATTEESLEDTINNIAVNSKNIYINLIRKEDQGNAASNDESRYIIVFSKTDFSISIISNWKIYYDGYEPYIKVKTNILKKGILFDNFVKMHKAVIIKRPQYTNKIKTEFLLRKFDDENLSIGRYVFRIDKNGILYLEYSHWYDIKYCPRARINVKNVIYYIFYSDGRIMKLKYRSFRKFLKRFKIDIYYIPDRFVDLDNIGLITSDLFIDEFTKYQLIIIIPSLNKLKFKIAQYQNMIGYRYYKEKKYFRAIEEFKISLRINDAFILPLYNIASCFALLNKVDKAIYYLKKYSIKYKGNLKMKIIKDDDFNNIRNSKKFINYLNKL